MPSNDYHFVTTWRLAQTTCAEVSDVLGNAEDLTRWWPSVYLNVELLEPGDARGVGKRARLLTKGRLRLSFVLKPVFSWNHHWAMARGYESMTRELVRRAQHQGA